MIPCRVTEPDWQRRKGQSKFNNIRNNVDGINFASKAEAAHYRQLKLRVANGDVLYFLRQVAIHLPGNIRYVIDFLEFWKDGSVHYIDVKGVETDIFKLKRKQVEALYPIKIETVKGRR